MNIEQAKKRLEDIVDFYKLNDENNYDYSDDVLISMKLVLEEIERLEKRNKEIYEGFMATQEELKEYAEENEQLHSIIKKVREYAKNDDNFFIIDAYSQPIVDRIQEDILEILDKENK